MDHGWHGNMTLMSNATNVTMAAATGGNSTFMVINEFKFLAARSIRTSTIILAVFNTVSAFATAAGILFDSYLKAKRLDPRRNQKVNIFKCVRGIETFPFILSLGITAQGIIFAVAQSHGLDGLFKAGCSLISQFMWPAVFIVPYIQLVFGLEVTIRGLRTKPFPPRGKWDVVICLVVIKALLLITGLVAVFIRAPNFCFASLFWFVAKWAEGAFALLILITVILVLCIALIYVKLTRHSTVETSERVGASRMVYYLIVAVLSNALIVPFFISLTFSDSMDGGSTSSLTLATISSVVANVSGLLTGCLYLFLRSSTISTIGPKDKISEYERQKLKYNIRLQGPDMMELDSRQISQSSPSPRVLRGRESQENLIAAEKGDSFEMTTNNLAPLQSNPFDFNDFRNPYDVVGSVVMPRAPDPVQSSTINPYAHGRRPSTSYSLFPGKQPISNAVTLLPSTTYSPNLNAGTSEPKFPLALDSASTLQPPPPMGPEGFRHHRRDSSLASHTTVQIGLRFSNVNEIGPIANKDSIEIERVHSLGCPNNPGPGLSQRPSPLAMTQQVESVASIAGSGSESPGSRESMMTEMTKSLPLITAPSPAQASSSGLTLSPTVYTPPGTASTSPTKTKIISPRGVGFNVPQRTNTTPTPEPSVPVPAPLRIRGQSNADKGREEWI